MIDQPFLLVGTGGAIGAVARFWVYEWVESERIESGPFPRATFVVNVLGSFLLGLVVFADLGDAAVQFVGVGICGAFTTFSTYSVETVRLWETGRRRLALVNAAVNLGFALAAIGLAWAAVEGVR